MRAMPIRIAVLLVVSIPSIAAVAQNIQVNKENRTIAVTATDEAKADPDGAVVHIGFEIYAPDAETAYTRASQLSNSIVDSLKAAGVLGKSIESDAQNLRRTEQQFLYNLSPEERAQKQFQVTESWTVKCSVENSGKLLHIAIAAGANNSGQIDWELKDHKQLQAQAAASALAKARAIADQMASGLHAHLGPLVYASNQSPQGFGVGAAGMVAMGGVMGGPLLSVKPLAVQPRQIEESATVYAVFAIE
jgi:uncharacterized protein YggE